MIKVIHQVYRVNYSIADATEETLLANRHGVLSNAQQAKFTNEYRRGWQQLVIFLLIICIFLVPAANLIAGHGFNYLYTGTSTLIYGVALFIPFGVFGAATAFWGYKWTRDIVENRVLQITGQLQKSRGYYGGTDTTFLKIGDMTFHIRPESADSLHNNSCYSLYYLPRTHQIISYEILESPREK